MTQPRNLENVSEETLERYKEIVERFKSKNATFFHKVMTRTIATETVKGPFSHQLEIPQPFANDNADKLSENVTLEIKDIDKKWQLKINVKFTKDTGKYRVYAYGINGWRDFVEDNDLKVGDLVVFCLVRFSKFLVFIYKAPVVDIVVNVDGESDDPIHEERNEHTHKDVEVKTEVEEETTMEVPMEVGCPLCGQAPPSPQFVITLCHSTIVAPGEEISVEMPAKFWQVHGALLPGDELHLQGPNDFIMRVKSRRTPYPLRLKVRLEEGWKRFCNANDVQIGDILLFSLIGTSFFKVQVMNRFD